jgi:hypothetical protein
MSSASAITRISIGMEFQTADANFLLSGRQENGHDTVYYIRHRKSFPVIPADKNCQCVVNATGDACTNESIKHFDARHLKQGKEVRLDLDGLDKEIYLMIDEDTEMIFNDAEFDVLFPEPQEWGMDRISILNGIIESIKKGAGILQKTLRTATTQTRFSSIHLDDTPLDNKKFPYKQIFLFKDSPYSMMTTKLQPLSALSYFTQITLGIPFYHVLDVLRILATELERTRSLHEEDRQQLRIFLDAEKDVTKCVEKNDATVYTMAVILVYWIRTRANRKASPFIFRHYMTSLLRQILSPDEKQRLIICLHTISPTYTEVVGMLRLMGDYQRSPREISSYQNVGTTTIYEMKSNIILVEIRFMYAFLDTWCTTDNGLHTLGALSRIPALRHLKKWIQRNKL